MNSFSSSFLRSFFLFVIFTPVFAQTTTSQTYIFTLCNSTSVVNATTGGSSAVNATTGGCGPVTNDVSDCMYSGPIRADGICTCDSVYDRCIRLTKGGIINTLNVTIYRYGRNQNNCEGTLLISHKNVPIDNVCRRVSGGVVNGSFTNSSFISVLVTSTQDYVYKKCTGSDYDDYAPKSSCGSLAYCATNPSSLFWVSGTGDNGNCNFDNCFGFLCRSKTSTSEYGASDHNAVGMCLYCAPPKGWGETWGGGGWSGYDSFGVYFFVRYILAPLLIIPSIYVCIFVCRRFGFDCCPNVSPRVCVKRQKRARGNQPALNQLTMNIPANSGFPIIISPYAAVNPHTLGDSQHRLNDPRTVSNPVSNSESEKLKRVAQLRLNLSYF